MDINLKKSPSKLMGFLKQKHRVNYFFFGFLFFLSSVSPNIYHISLIANQSIVEKNYFVFYAIGQCL